jgi:hypothetical protein
VKFVWEVSLGCQISKFWVFFFWFLAPKIFTKNAVRCVLRWNLLYQTQVFYLSWEELVWEVRLGCQISKFWVNFLVSGPQYSYQKCHQIFYTVKFAEKTQGLAFLSRNLYGKYPKDSKFQNSRVHQDGPKAYVSQNFSFLAFIGTELVLRQISLTALVRDRRKNLYRSNHVF